jgi:hypothetical protein
VWLATNHGRHQTDRHLLLQLLACHKNEFQHKKKRKKKRKRKNVLTSVKNRRPIIEMITHWTRIKDKVKRHFFFFGGGENKGDPRSRPVAFSA